MVSNSTKIVRHQQKQWSKNGSKKKNFSKHLFNQWGILFSNFFFLFLVWICLKFTAKKEKSSKFFLHTENGGVRHIGYTYRGGYTYRAGCNTGRW